MQPTEEGLAFATAFALVVSAAGFRGRLSGCQLGAIAAGLLPCLAVVIAYRLENPTVSDVVGGLGERQHLMLDPKRHAIMLAALGKHLVRFGNGLPLAALALLMFRRRGPGGASHPSLGAALAILVLTVLCYYAVLVLTPHDLEWHVRTTYSRLSLHVWPSLLLIAGLSWTPGAMPLGRRAREYRS